MRKNIISIPMRLFYACVIGFQVLALLVNHVDVSAAPQWPEPRVLTTFSSDAKDTVILSALSTSGDFAYFLAEIQHYGDPNFGSCDLWVSDGSPSGVRDIMPVVYDTNAPTCMDIGKETLPLGIHGLLFDTYTYTGQPKEFYSTDGVNVVKLLDGPATNLVNIDGQVYFLYSDYFNGLGVWTTDGTPQGTQMIKKLPGSKASAYWDGQELLVIVLYGDGSTWLWKTNGTIQGTVAVSQIINQNFYRVSNWTRYKGKAYFMIQNLVSDTPFDAPWALWSTDGREAGTSKVYDLPYGNAIPYFFAGADNLLFLIMGNQANYPSVEYTLWQSDGTATGTQTISDTLLSAPKAVITYKDAMYWYNYPDHSFKKSSGKAGGVKTVLAGYPSNSQNILFVQNNLLYLASMHAWVTDGNSLTELAGPQDYSHPVNLTGFCGQLFFTLMQASSATGLELWKSGDTPQGTGVYADLIPGPDSSNPTIVGVAGDKLYFVTSDSANGIRLWVVDDPYMFRAYIPVVSR